MPSGPCVSPRPRAQQAWRRHPILQQPRGAEDPGGCSRASLPLSPQIFPGLILSDIKPAKRMKFKTVCYLLVQLMQCRKMFKAEIPFSNVMTCEDDDKVAGRSDAPARGRLPCFPAGMFA